MSPCESFFCWRISRKRSPIITVILPPVAELGYHQDFNSQPDMLSSKMLTLPVFAPIGVRGPSPSRTALRFRFLGMRVLRLCALDARSGCRRTVYFADGVDSFGFLGRFLRALAPGEELH